MSQGWKKVEDESAAQQARRDRFDAQSGMPQIFKKEIERGRPGDGPVIVRFLEQAEGVFNFDTHQYNVPDTKARGGAYARRFTCLREFGKDCPGCAAGLPMKVRGVFNLIQRQRAVLRKGADGKAVKDSQGNWLIDGYADAVVIFEVANTTATMIRRKDNDYRGLMSRDLALGLSGDNFQPYTLEPADIDSGPQHMSEADMALAANKHDLNKFMENATPQEAAQIVAKYGANSGANQSHIPSSAPPAVPNPYLAGAQLPSGSPFAAAQVPAPQQPPATAPASVQG